MNKNCVRADGRHHNQVRPISISIDTLSNAHTSVLFGFGQTKVLCAVTMQPQVPHFLKGTKTGWLTAEYAMLPTSTESRTPRESSGRVNGRSVEISRLIGRSLRSMIDLSQLGERTIIIDCDVLQADGGTRTASITAASLALQIAVNRWIASRDLRCNIITDPVAAVSVGMIGNNVLLDIDYSEDSKVIADYNFVLSRSGNVVEMQGSVENGEMSWDNFDDMRCCAIEGMQTIFTAMEPYLDTVDLRKQKNEKKEGRVPLFSIQARQKSVSSS